MNARKKTPVVTVPPAAAREYFVVSEESIEVTDFDTMFWQTRTCAARSFLQEYLQENPPPNAPCEGSTVIFMDLLMAGVFTQVATWVKDGAQHTWRRNANAKFTKVAIPADSLDDYLTNRLSAV